MSQLTKSKWCRLIALACLVVALGATGMWSCDGGGTDSSSSTDVGNDKTLNPAVNATSLSATITKVTIPNAGTTGGAPTVEFTVTDQNGNGVTGLTDIRVHIAKLIEAAEGEPSHWQSYINAIETVAEGDDGTEAAGTTAIRATSVRSTVAGDGTLTEVGGGEYSFLFGKDLSQITTASGAALDVDYEPTLTHRVAIQINTTNEEGDTIWANPVYDFKPSTGATTGLTTREIVMTSKCSECHDDLGLHGGGRNEVKLCVVCHNPGSTDAHSGNSVDMAEMIHKIHKGETLPSVENGGSYKIWGYQNTEADYSTVVFPQDTRHCDTCHDPADTETPDAQNYAATPYIRACQGCHDDIVFDGSTPAAWQTAHSGGTATNSECANCHGGNGATVDGSIGGVHDVPTQTNGANYQYNIISITNTAPGQTPVAVISVTNPTTGEAYDIVNDEPYSTAAGGSLNVKFAWEVADYSNFDSGQKVGQVVSVNARTAGVSNGDGTYTVTSTKVIPATATGSGIVYIDGRPVEDLNGDGTYGSDERILVDNVVEYFAITDEEAEARREVVSIDRCNKCHGKLSLHGNNRVNSIEVCVTCHNANATDIQRRPALTAVGGVYTDTSVVGADNKSEESVDMKYMIHAIHAGKEEEHGMRENGIVVYGFGGTAYDFSEVRYPTNLNNCLKCHETDTYLLPLGEDVLATSVETFVPGSNTATTNTALLTPDDDNNISPESAVCSSCHDSTLAITHMGQNGGEFSETQANITTNASETCAVCHGSGRSADVKTVHGITE